MSRAAIVVGSGRSVWNDLRTIEALQLEAPSVFAVNDMIVFAPTVHHGVSHHEGKLPHWIALRSGPRVTAHASADGPGIDQAWPQFRKNGPSGSSSLLAAQIALELGHDHVFIAGVPLDASGYIWTDSRATTPLRDFARYRRGWEHHAHELRGRVVAVSGYLADLLGTPAQWAAPRVAAEMAR